MKTLPNQDLIGCLSYSRFGNLFIKLLIIFFFFFSFFLFFLFQAPKRVDFRFSRCCREMVLSVTLNSLVAMWFDGAQ